MMNSMLNSYYNESTKMWSTNSMVNNLSSRSSSRINETWPTATTNSSNTGYGSSMPVVVQAPLLLSSSSPMSPAEIKAVAGCKTHKEAERRRRKRINAHLATLRSLLPDLLKTDKASVLGEVVRRVRELKRAAAQLTADDDVDGTGSRSCLLPGDMDEVKLSKSQNDSTILVATLSCEDRPEFIVDLTRALRSVKARVVRAEMATVGGRTKSVLWVRGVGGGGGGGPEGLLRRALKVVVDKPCSSSSGMGHLGLMVGSRFHRPYYNHF